MGFLGQTGQIKDSASKKRGQQETEGSRGCVRFWFPALLARKRTGQWNSRSAIQVHHWEEEEGQCCGFEATRQWGTYAFSGCQSVVRSYTLCEFNKRWQVYFTSCATPNESANWPNHPTHPSTHSSLHPSIHPHSLCPSTYSSSFHAVSYSTDDIIFPQNAKIWCINYWSRVLRWVAVFAFLLSAMIHDQ